MSKHKFTQEDTNGKVTAGVHHVDEVNIINELRQIAEDLATIIGQVKLGDGNYPADGTAGILATNVKKNNFEAIDYPLVTDDETKGYKKGSLWIYEEAYICTDATEGFAIWKQITNEELIS